MAEQALSSTELHEALASGFAEDLQRHFPTHRLELCRHIVEGEQDVYLPCGTRWRQLTVWYNLNFQPYGILVQSNCDIGRCLAYSNPRLMEDLVAFLARLTGSDRFG